MNIHTHTHTHSHTLIQASNTLPLTTTTTTMAHIMRATRPALSRSWVLLARQPAAAVGATAPSGSQGILANTSSSSSSSNTSTTLSNSCATRWLSTKAAPERPLSPHLTIYKFGLNAITSVGHRGTGMFMMGGTQRAATTALHVNVKAHTSLTKCMHELPLSGLCASSVFLAASGNDLAFHVDGLRAMGVLPLVKMAVAGPLIYHFLTGVRHIVSVPRSSSTTSSCSAVSLYMLICCGRAVFCLCGSAGITWWPTTWRQGVCLATPLLPLLALPRSAWLSWTFSLGVKTCILAVCSFLFDCCSVSRFK